MTSIRRRFLSRPRSEGATAVSDAATAHDELFTRHTVPIGSAARVRARIGMNVGRLRVSGGATILADGAFRYTADLEPLVEYEDGDELGTLSICQRTPAASHHRRGRNEWDIALAESVPMDLEIVHSTGDGRFDLSRVALRSLALDRATGSTALLLRGDYPDLSQARIESATGNLDLGLTGRFAVLESLAVSGGTGSLDADLSGVWEHDVEVRLRVATGSIHVRLPDTIGLEVKAATALGRVRVSGLATTAGGWRRDAPADVPVMRLDASAAVGSVTIEAAS